MEENTFQKTEKLYYIQNGYVGNAISWWRADRNGYTTDIRLAGKYSEEEAKMIAKNRPEDIAWLCEHIDQNEKATKVIIDGQYLDKSFQFALNPDQ